MRDVSAEIDRLLQRFDTETATRRFSMEIGGLHDEVAEFVSAREDIRAGLAARIARDIARDEHGQS